MTPFYDNPKILSDLLSSAHRRIIPKTGDKFGMLEFTGRFFYYVSAPSQTTDFMLAAECRCECGCVRVYRLYDLQYGASKACYCQKQIRCRKMNEARRIYPRHDVRIRSIWGNMISRCHNPANSAFPGYGGRGIYVCDEWRGSFPVFLEWATKAEYEYGKSIERINNSLGYSPGNCRWATPLEQNRNRRTNLFITAWGETKCLAEWCEDPRNAVPYTALRYRIVDLKMSPEIAMTTPHNKR